MKASVLAVGTELTSGQITNRNAAWVSKRLSDLGVQTEIHITVADDRTAILEALVLLSQKSDLIFVSGGLGPTSDDFTRELITEWAEQPAEFHEPSWQKIQDRLNARNLPIKDFQKQQCYFPKNSRVLDNSVGTANAFYLTKGTKHLWALPGPPNEILAVWTDHIHSQLEDLTKDLNRYMTVSWDALGLGEAVAPSLIEHIVKDSGAEVGYRVHMPYLEIKLSFYKSEQEKMKPYIAKVEEALKAYTVSRDGDDILNPLNKILLNVPHLFVRDEISEGLLFSRLQTIRTRELTLTTDKSLVAQGKSWQILCHFVNEFEYELELLSPQKKPFKKLITSPFGQVPQMSQRRRQYFTEVTLITAVQHWRD